MQLLELEHYVIKRPIVTCLIKNTMFYFHVLQTEKKPVQSDKARRLNSMWFVIPCQRM